MFGGSSAFPAIFAKTTCARRKLGGVVAFFEETIYENRMAHIKYLQMMNANIEHTNMRAKIVGPTKLVGREITAQDLRGGAALVLAGLIAEGLTIVNDADHILRGYERIIEKLTNVGAKIKIE